MGGYVQRVEIRPNFCGQSAGESGGSRAGFERTQTVLSSQQ